MWICLGSSRDYKCDISTARVSVLEPRIEILQFVLRDENSENESVHISNSLERWLKFLRLAGILSKMHKKCQDGKQSR